VYEVTPPDGLVTALKVAGFPLMVPVWDDEVDEKVYPPLV
jgi:hypothetical protein